ncbi:MAG TPA: O-antigen ligase family protein [Thermoanaerobaculaceae bacterium]|nr:O-antigen ligase family protein [Thermoanaerobaculaceae bacterium]
MAENVAEGSGRARAVAAASLVAVAATSCQLGVANPILLVLIVALWRAWRRGELAGRPAGRKLLAPMALFAAASVASVAFSPHVLASLDKLPRIAILLLAPAAAALIDETWWPRLVAALAAVATLLAVWGIIQYLQGADTLDDRIHGPMAHYMIYSGWLLLCVTLLLTELLLDPRRRIWLLLPPVLLGTVALILSFTRNSWVGLAAGLLVLAAVWRRQLLLLYPVLAVVVWLVFPRPILDRVISIFDLRQHSNYDRLCMTISGLQMVRDYPLTGVGLDMVARLYPLYRRDDAPRWEVPHLHNNLVQIAAERGLPALAAYLWLIGAYLVATWRAAPRLTGPPRAALAASLVATVAITVAGLFEYNFWSASVQYLTLVVMGVGIGRAEEARG